MMSWVLPHDSHRYRPLSQHNEKMHVLAYIVAKLSSELFQHAGQHDDAPPHNLTLHLRLTHTL
jgi:hypothetical protein